MLLVPIASVKNYTFLQLFYTIHIRFFSVYVPLKNWSNICMCKVLKLVFINIVINSRTKMQHTTVLFQYQ